MDIQEEKRFSVRFPPDVLEAIRQLAQEEDRSLNAEIVHAVRFYITIRAARKLMESSFPDEPKSL